MVSARKRNTALEAISMIMLEKGKILDKHEYERMKERTPVRAGTILNLFGSWSRMLGIMESSFPKVWAEIKTKENPPPKSISPKVPKPEVMVKPAVRPAVKKDKDDE